MKKLLVPVLIGFAATSSIAADKFVGPSVGLGVTYSKNKADYSGFVNGSSSDNDTSASLRGSYGFALGKDWVGTVGLEYAPTKQDFGRITYVSGGTQTVTVKMKDAWAVSFAPGYRLTPNSLVYGKLAYHAAKSEYTDTLLGNGSRDHTGFGYGLGYAISFASNLEASLEFEHIDYSGESANLTTGKPKQDAVTVGINYRF